MMDIVENVAL